MTFRDKRFEHIGNHYKVVGHTVRVYQYNSGKNANYLVTAGTIQKSFYKGQSARDEAIQYALELAKSGRYENGKKQNSGDCFIYYGTMI